MGSRFEERMREELGNTAVDPARFLEACERLNVWEEGVSSSLWEVMYDLFEDDATSATMRFLDLGQSLRDGTLTEFQWDTDEGMVATTNAVVLAAAIVPLDGETNELDRRAWFAEAMRILAAEEREG